MQTGNHTHAKNLTVDSGEHLGTVSPRRSLCPQSSVGLHGQSDLPSVNQATGCLFLRGPRGIVTL